MKLQNLTVIFIIIIIPVILLVSLYISTGLKTIKYQSLYDTGLLTATHDAIYAFELNTTNDAYSDNSETKRNILKSSVKMFEKSLANTCGISSYNTDEIEEYIPAIVFGMYDGFYMYAPSYNSKTGKYEHDLKNYVYYSETLDDDIVITYSLDNYVTVAGKFNDNYIVKEGYLIDLNNSTGDGKKYKGIDIKPEIIDGQENIEGIEYYKDAYEFTEWFKDNVADKAYFLRINSDNDPEDETSSFVQHKREIMKNKIERVLNSSITAYSERTWGRTYKMPKLSEEDWQKIYSNISMITFFQGKSIGLTKYNGYCVLNSTNSNEYVNPNLMYFIDDSNEYHDIRCGKCEDETKLIGYKIGDFQKVKLEKVLNTDGTPKTDESGNQLYDNDGTETTSAYKYKHMELACYDCVNSSLSTNTSVYNYVKPNDGTANSDIKTAYWTSLARERFNTTKLLAVGKGRIIKWEQEPNSTKIYGKDRNENIIITLNIGDYINYKGETKNWRVIGVEAKALAITPNKKPGEMLQIYNTDFYEEAYKKMDVACETYLDSNIATSARSIEISDVNKLCELYIDGYKNAFEDGYYGDGTLKRVCFGFDWENDNYEYKDIEITKYYESYDSESDIYKLLFPYENGGYWIKGYYTTQDTTNTHGLYGTWNNEDNNGANLYGAHLNDSGFSSRFSYIRPVVILKREIDLEKEADDIDGTYDSYNILNTEYQTTTSCSHNWNSYEEYHECTKCGYTYSHNWYAFDRRNHICTYCGKQEYHDSYEGCSVCGYTCTHSWYASDPWNHTCSYCGKQESHDSYEGCSVCGYTCTHSWYASDPWNHTCSYCGKQESHDSYARCSVCGYHSHSWYGYDSSYHKCTGCGEEDYHSWNNGSCTVCKYKCRHNWKDGTCTVCGYPCSHNWVHPYPGTMICTICGEIVR